MSSFVSEGSVRGNADCCNHVDATKVKGLDPRGIVSLDNALAKSALLNAHVIMSQYRVEASISKFADRYDWKLSIAPGTGDVPNDAILQQT